MPHTISIILPWLGFLAGGGSGVVASWMFDRLRESVPQEQIPAGNWLGAVLYAPRYARLLVLLLGAVISLAASVLVAELTGGDLPGAFDTAFAAAVSGVASQLMHARQLSTDPPPSASSPETRPPVRTPPASPEDPPPPPPFPPMTAAERSDLRARERHGSAGPVVPVEIVDRRRFIAREYDDDPPPVDAGVNHHISTSDLAYSKGDRRSPQPAPYIGPERRKPRDRKEPPA